MTVVADLEDFITDHRSHGELTPEVGEPTPNGYLIEVACCCGVVYGPLDHARGRRGGPRAGAFAGRELSR
jgi:hypothetical protein